MVHIFTGGLFYKTREHGCEPPEGLVKAVQNLRFYPDKIRIVREALDLAKGIIHKELHPIILTLSAVITYNAKSSKPCMIGYIAHPVHEEGLFEYADGFHFNFPEDGKDEEIAITEYYGASSPFNRSHVDIEIVNVSDRTLIDGHRLSCSDEEL